MLEQLTGSLTAFIYSYWPVKAYQFENPLEPQIPSFYVPAPTSTSSRHSKDAFQSSYLIPIKIFCETNRVALFKANELADLIKSRNFNIPLLNEDGSFSGQVADITSNISTDIVADGVASLTLEFEVTKSYEGE